MKKLKSDLRKASNKEQAEQLARFFKTKPGEYGEGDIFLGIKVPLQRKIAKDAEKRLSVEETLDLLNSKIHDERMVALLVLIEKYEKAKKSNNEKEKTNIFNFYLKNAKLNNINNWDLVDLSAPKIIGDFLLDKKQAREVLYKLARSENLWEKRIAIISTFAFIRQRDFQDALKISELLLKDKHDLIHKAVGWMLREIGKKDERLLRKFLKENYHNLPRTTLRYAIEKFDEDERKGWLLSCTLRDSF